MRLRSLLAHQPLIIKLLAIFMISVTGLVVGVMVSSAVCSHMADAGHDEVSCLIVEQGILSIISFAIAGYACIYMTQTRVREVFEARGMTMVAVAIPAVVAIIASTPFINQLTVWNEAMVLPESMKEIEEMIRSMEDTANDLTMQFLSRTSFADFAVNLFVLALIPAIGEELMFRGAIQGTLTESGCNRHVAVILTSVLFSAIHFQFYGFLPRMALGMILGYAYLWSGTIWVPSLMHFINNAIVVAAAYVISLTNPEALTEETMGEVDAIGTGCILIPLLSLAVVVGMMYVIKRHYDTARTGEMWW